MRSTVIVANWKMHKTIAETVAFVNALAPKVKNSKSKVLIAPPFTAISAAAEAVRGSQIFVGAQNISEHKEGAYTGEVSALQIAEAGARFVILGHSERRHYFHESNAQINIKIKNALGKYLIPILCVGETLDQHKSGHTHEVVKQQLEECLLEINVQQAVNLIIAYEPVWAIGTGLTATPETAQSVHAYCREVLKKFWGETVAEKIPLLYGGSVKADNARQLMGEKDIDGLLVGGASLSVETFSSIVNY